MLGWIDPVGLSRCNVNAQAYEEKIQDLYGGKLAQSERIYGTVVNGKDVIGIADHVVRLNNGKRKAIEAKYVKDWTKSLQNPKSSIGDRFFAEDEQKAMLAQTQKYSVAFDEIVYHTNSQELADHYGPIFKNAGLNNVSFMVTPYENSS